jgi:decaprenylphospho-beta-D-erythro-pentofuranosid-2-ulose 2-reductase
MQKVIVLGATSGIAQEVQRMLALSGKEMMLVARSPERLSALRSDLLVRGAREVLTFTADLADTSTHVPVLEFARNHLANFDTIFLTYGTMLDQQECQRSAALACQEIDTNFVSAVALLTVFAQHFESAGTGCIAAITSVAGDRGRRSNYVYGAAKGALSLFLQGLRSRLYPAGVRVITIKPGPVKTAMTDQMKKSGIFADAEDVARDIYRALEKRSPDVLYTPRRWRLIMAVVRAIPESVFKRLAF